jgi:hypothetical protein
VGVGLSIVTSIKDANEILRVVNNPDLLLNWNWEWGPHHLDVAARWLPKKGFKILPKIFDANYKPGTVGDEGDKLIVEVQGCTIRSEDGWEPIPVWHEQILKLPEMREELKRIVEGNVFDMSFEEEVVREMERVHGKDDVYYKADKESLDEDNYTLKMFGEILTMLADCIDQVKRTKGLPPVFEFYIHE